MSLTALAGRSPILYVLFVLFPGNHCITIEHFKPSIAVLLAVLSLLPTVISVSTAKMRFDLLRTTLRKLSFSNCSVAGDLTSVDFVQECHQQMLDQKGRLLAMISISPLSYTPKVAT